MARWCLISTALRQSLTGRFASGGQLTGSGTGAAETGRGARPPRLQPEKARIKVPVADVEVGADLIVTGALVNPQIGGRLEISNGAIKPRRTKVTRDPSSGQDQSSTTSPMRRCRIGHHGGCVAGEQ